MLGSRNIQRMEDMIEKLMKRVENLEKEQETMGKALSDVTAEMAAVRDLNGKLQEENDNLKQKLTKEMKKM